MQRVSAESEHIRYLSVPHLDGVVPQAGDNLGVVVLEAVNSFAVLASAVDSLQVVLATPPVVLNGLQSWSSYYIIISLRLFLTS